MRVLIAPDKFKGTLTAQQAARAMARGWSKARPQDLLELLPMSDGGDGFGEVLSKLLGAHRRGTVSQDAAHRPLRCAWWWEANTKTAIVESAKMNGLAMLAGQGFHPLQLDTFGLGKILRAAEKAGARKAIIGVGGSATNDGGFGLARALGWQFLGRQGQPLEEWWQLGELRDVRRPARPIELALRVAVDVQNPLLGSCGCSRIYGPQKGLRLHELEFADKCLARMAAVLETQHGIVDSEKPGAGAAGGLGFGLSAFAGASIESGFDLFAHHAQLSQRIGASNLVITGEGAMDEQTLMGKGVGQMARLCSLQRVPCLGVAGVVAEVVRQSSLFTATRGLTEVADLARAKSHAGSCLEKLCQTTAAAWRSTRVC